MALPKLMILAMAAGAAALTRRGTVGLALRGGSEENTEEAVSGGVGDTEAALADDGGSITDVEITEAEVADAKVADAEMAADWAEAVSGGVGDLLRDAVGDAMGKVSNFITATPVEEGGNETAKGRMSRAAETLLNRVRQRDPAPGSDDVPDVPSSAADLGSLRLKPRVVSFNVMVAGLSGLGKTTTCNMLFETWKQPESGPPSLMSALPKIMRPTRHVDVSRCFEYFDEEANTILRVRVIDTPGFGNNIDHKHAVRPLTKYINRCRDEQFIAQMSARQGEAAESYDCLVHACIYFISPHRFLNIDRHFLHHVQHDAGIAIIPVIAKSDTLTDDEIAEYRSLLRREFEAAKITVVDFDEKTESKPLFGRTFARGRTRGDPLGVVGRDGDYPWGSSKVFNREHSDFALLKELLLSEHTEALVEHAKERYAAYRARRVRMRAAKDAAKTLCFLALTARAFGVGPALPVPTLDQAFTKLANLRRALVAALARNLPFSRAPPPEPAAEPPLPPPPRGPSDGFLRFFGLRQAPK